MQHIFRHVIFFGRQNQNQNQFNNFQKEKCDDELSYKNKILGQENLIKLDFLRETSSPACY